MGQRRRGESQQHAPLWVRLVSAIAIGLSIAAPFAGVLVILWAIVYMTGCGFTARLDTDLDAEDVGTLGAMLAPVGGPVGVAGGVLSLIAAVGYGLKKRGDAQAAKAAHEAENRGWVEAKAEAS